MHRPSAPMLPSTTHDVEDAIPSPFSLAAVWAVLGPGLMVCLADSDIGGVFTMAVAGSRFGYKLLSLQILLIPVLIIVQQMVVVLGVCCGRSLVGLVHDHIGSAAANVMSLICVGIGASALISELSGVAAVGELLGLTPVRSCACAASVLIMIVMAGGYRAVERAGMCLGACLGIFVVVSILCHPPWEEVMFEAIQPPSMSLLSKPEFREVITANIGTVVTPWMLFYQMSAVIEKRIRPSELGLAAIDTTLGAILTQVVMCSVLIIFAVTSRDVDPEKMTLNEVFLSPLRSVLGDAVAVACISCGLLGSSLLAAIVIALGVAWNLADYRGEESPLKCQIRDAPWFYAGFSGIVIFGAFIVAIAGIKVTTLILAIQVLNGLGMVAIVGVVFYLSVKEGVLPEDRRLHGSYSWVVGSLVLACCSIAFWMSLEAIPEVVGRLLRP